MEIEEALKAYISSYPGLASLVGNRVYPDTLPQNCQKPAIVYTLISENEVETFKTPDNNLIYPTFQFDCWGNSRANANAVSKQLRLAFKNYHGVMGGENGVTVDAIVGVGKTTDFDDNRNEYRVIREYEIWYWEV